MGNAYRAGRVLSVLIAASPGLFGGALCAQATGSNPYRATLGWERLPEGRTLGIVSGVIPDPDGEHLWILDRCGANQCAGTDIDPIMKFDLGGIWWRASGPGCSPFPTASRWTRRDSCG